MPDITPKTYDYNKELADTGVQNINEVPPVDLSTPLGVAEKPGVDGSLFDKALVQTQQSLPQKNPWIAGNKFNQPTNTRLKDTERYTNKTLGFSPFNPYQEEQYGENQSIWSQIGNNLAKTGVNIAGSFAQTLIAIPSVVNAIAHGDASKIYNNDVNTGISNWMDSMENKLPNYKSFYEEQHPIMSYVNPAYWGNSLGGAVKNIGFVAGALVGAVVEDAAVGSVTAGLGDVPLVANQVNRMFGRLSKVLNAGDESIQGLNDAIKAGKDLQQQVNTLSATKKIVDKTRYGLELITSSMANGAFQAQQTYKSTLDELTKDFYDTHGYEASGEELDKIEKYAKDAGNTDLAAVVATSALAHSIIMPTLLKPMGAARAYLEGRTNVVGGIKRAAGSLDTFEESVNPSKGLKGLLLKRLTTPTEGLIKSGVGAAELNTQMIVQRSAQDFFKRKYDDETLSDTDNLMKSVSTGLNDFMFTREGFDSTMLGLLTGAAMHGLSVIIDAKRGLTSSASAQTKAMVALLNKNTLTGLFQGRYDEIANAVDIQKRMKSAIANNDVFEFHNLKFQQLYDFVHSGVKSNRFDLRLDQLSDLKNLLDADFKKMFGLDSTEESRKTVSSYVDSVIEKAHEIKKNVEKVEEAFKNPHNLKTNPTNWLAFEDFKKQLGLDLSEVDDNNKRIKSLGSDISKLAPMVDVNKIVNLTSQEGLNQTIKNFKARISEIKKDEELAKSDKAVSNKLAKEREFLEDKVGIFQGNMKNFDPDVYLKHVEETLNYFSNANNIEGDNNISPVDVLSIFNKAGDVYKLGENARAALENYRALTNKKGFGEYIRRVIAKKNDDADKIKFDYNGDFVSSKAPEELPENKGFVQPTKTIEGVESIDTNGKPIKSADQYLDEQKQKELDAAKTANNAVIPIEVQKEINEKYDKLKKSTSKKVKDDIVKQAKEQGEEIYDPSSQPEVTDEELDKHIIKKSPTKTAVKNTSAIKSIYEKINPFRFFNKIFSQNRPDGHQELTNLRDVLFHLSPDEINDKAGIQISESTQGKTIEDFTKVGDANLFRRGYDLDVELTVDGKNVGRLQPSDSLYFMRDGEYVPVTQLTKSEYAKVTGNSEGSYEDFMNDVKKYDKIYSSLIEQYKNGKASFTADDINPLFDLIPNYGGRKNVNSEAGATPISKLNHDRSGDVFLSVPMVYDKDTKDFARTSSPTILNFNDLTVEQKNELTDFLDQNGEAIKNINSRYIYLKRLPNGKLSNISIIAARPVRADVATLDSVLRVIKNYSGSLQDSDIKRINANLKDSIYIADSNNRKGNKTNMFLSIDKEHNTYLNIINKEQGYSKRLKFTEFDLKDVNNFESFVNVLDNKVKQISNVDAGLSKLNLTLSKEDFKRGILEDEKASTENLANSLTLAATPDIFDNYSLTVVPKGETAKRTSTAPKEPKPTAPKVAKPATKSTLPQDLKGAKPRYSYGDKKYELDFDNEIDKAAYITAQGKRSNRDADYLKFVMNATGMSEEEVRQHGRDVKAVIKGMAAVGKGDETLTVPSQYAPVLEDESTAVDLRSAGRAANANIEVIKPEPKQVKEPGTTRVKVKTTPSKAKQSGSHPEFVAKVEDAVKPKPKTTAPKAKADLVEAAKKNATGQNKAALEAADVVYKDNPEKAVDAAIDYIYEQVTIPVSEQHGELAGKTAIQLAEKEFGADVVKKVIALKEGKAEETAEETPVERRKPAEDKVKVYTSPYDLSKIDTKANEKVVFSFGDDKANAYVLVDPDIRAKYEREKEAYKAEHGTLQGFDDYLANAAKESFDLKYPTVGSIFDLRGLDEEGIRKTVEEQKVENVKRDQERTKEVKKKEVESDFPKNPKADWQRPATGPEDWGQKRAIQEAVLDKKYEEAIDKGEMTYQQAVNLIKSAGMAPNKGIQERMPAQPADTPLTETGEKQAVALKPILEENGIHKVVSSPYERAERTAEIATEGTDIPITLNDKLREKGNDESNEAFAKRVASAREDIAKMSKDTAVSTHGEVLKMLKALDDNDGNIKAAVAQYEQQEDEFDNGGTYVPKEGAGLAFRHEQTEANAQQEELEQLEEPEKVNIPKIEPEYKAGDIVKYNGNDVKIQGIETMKSGNSYYILEGDKIVPTEELEARQAEELEAEQVVKPTQESVVDGALADANQIASTEGVNREADRAVWNYVGLQGVLGRLMEKYGIPYKIVDEDGSWKGRIRNGVVEINMLNYTNDTPFHEYYHPFVEIMKVDNPELYKSISNEFRESEEGKTAIQKARETYPDLTEQEHQDEALVEYMGKAASEHFEQITNDEGKIEVVKKEESQLDFARRLYNKFKDWFLKLWKKNNVSTIKDIPATASLQDVIDISALHEVKFNLVANAKMINGLERYQNEPQSKYERFTNDLKRRLKVLEDTAKNRVLSTTLQDEARSLRAILRNENEVDSMNNYIHQGISSLDFANREFTRITRRISAGNLTDSDVNGLNNDLRVVKNLVAFYDDVNGLFENIVDGLDPEEYKSMSEILRKNEELKNDKLKNVSVKLVTEWLYPFVDDLRARTDPRLIDNLPTKDEFRKLIYQANGDVGGLFYLLGSVGSSKDPVSAVVSNVLRTLVDKTMFDNMEKNQKVLHEYDNFLKTKGLPNEAKATEEYYKNNYLRKASSLEKVGNKEDGSPKMDYVDRWAFHEKYFNDLFEKEKGEFIAGLGEQPDDVEPEKVEAWNQQVFDWYDKNTELVDGERIPSARFLNPKFAELYGKDKYFTTLYDNYKNSNELLGPEKLKHGIVPQVAHEKGAFSDLRKGNFKEAGGKFREKIEANPNYNTVTKGEGAEKSETHYSKELLNLDGTTYKSVKTAYTRMVDEDDLDLKLPETINKFTSASNTYKAFREIEPNIETLKSVVAGNEKLGIEARKVAKLGTDSKPILDRLFGFKTSKTEQTIRLNKQLLEFVDDAVYGEHRIEEVLKIGNFNISMNKIGDNLGFLTALNNMAGNLNAGIVNVAIGNLQSLGEAIGGRYTTPKDWAAAQGDYFGNFGEFIKDTTSIKKSLITQLAIMHDAIQGEFRDNYGKEVVGNFAQRYAHADTLFVLSHAGEHQIQIQGMIALMRGQKVPLKDGGFTDYFHAWELDKKGYAKLKDNVVWSEKDKLQFMSRLQSINKTLNGNYSTFDRTVMQRRWYGKLTLLYRKYLFNAFRARYSAKRYDYELQDVTEGYYRKFFGKLWNDMKTYKFEAAKRLWTKEGWSPEERYAFNKTAYELSFVTGAVALSIVIGAAEDKKKDKTWGAQEFYLQLLRINNDMSQYTVFGFQDMVRIMKNPTAVMNTIGNYYNFMSQLVSDPFEKYKKKQGHYDKGESVLKAKFYRMLPVMRQAVNFMTPENQIQYYQLMNLKPKLPTAPSNQ